MLHHWCAVKAFDRSVWTPHTWCTDAWVQLCPASKLPDLDEEQLSQRSKIKLNSKMCITWPTQRLICCYTRAHKKCSDTEAPKSLKKEPYDTIVRYNCIWLHVSVLRCQGWNWTNHLWREVLTTSCCVSVYIVVVGLVGSELALPRVLCVCMYNAWLWWKWQSGLGFGCKWEPCGKLCKLSVPHRDTKPLLRAQESWYYFKCNAWKIGDIAQIQLIKTAFHWLLLRIKAYSNSVWH